MEARDEVRRLTEKYEGTVALSVFEVFGSEPMNGREAYERVKFEHPSITEDAFWSILRMLKDDGLIELSGEDSHG